MPTRLWIAGGCLPRRTRHECRAAGADPPLTSSVMSDHAGTVIVLAKEPVPGRVKTRLQPAFSASEAAVLAAAAIEDTRAAVRQCSATRRILAWEGDPTSWQDGFEVVRQPPGVLNVRLAAALAAALSVPTDEPALLIGMDTPQVSAQLLDTDWEGADAVLGLSEDGGFWSDWSAARASTRAVRRRTHVDQPHRLGATSPTLRRGPERQAAAAAPRC